MPKLPSDPTPRKAAKTTLKAASKLAAKPARRVAPKVAFPKKNQAPTAAAYASLLPLPLGKRFEAVRGFLRKQKDVTEDVYFYGPKSGWGLRYLAGQRPLCTLFVHGARPLGILALDAAASALVDWKGLSPVGRNARRSAHGSPSLLWLDVPLDGAGAADFKTLARAKVTALAAATPSRSA